MTQSTDILMRLQCTTRPDHALVHEAADEIERLRGLLRAILEADERGQGLPFAEAMEAAHAHLESVGAR